MCGLLLTTNAFCRMHAILHGMQSRNLHIKIIFCRIHRCVEHKALKSWRENLRFLVAKTLPSSLHQNSHMHVETQVNLGYLYLLRCYCHSTHIHPCRNYRCSQTKMDYSNSRNASGGFSSGAGIMQCGLYVHVRPLTATLTSPVGNTFTMRPAWPNDWKEAITGWLHSGIHTCSVMKDKTTT